jgi:cell fate regulator YaaT (PSP1 superfamily)
VNVRLRLGGQVQVFDCGDLPLELGDWVLVKVDDVTRMGVVTTVPLIHPGPPEGKPVYLPSNRRLLRAADLDDLSLQAENELEEREAFDFCAMAAKRLGLVMKLVSVEKTFDRFKTIFYYTAEDRVDFRQLVKDLVRRLRTRVEMRQISVRSEALMLGGNGLCGRPLCCASFLKDFYPVSVRMAKEQNIAINTLKISGVCGRLMCCLAFESAACGKCCRAPRDLASRQAGAAGASGEGAEEADFADSAAAASEAADEEGRGAVAAASPASPAEAAEASEAEPEASKSAFTEPDAAGAASSETVDAKAGTSEASAAAAPASKTVDAKAGTSKASAAAAPASEASAAAGPASEASAAAGPASEASAAAGPASEAPAAAAPASEASAAAGPASEASAAKSAVMESGLAAALALKSDAAEAEVTKTVTLDPGANGGGLDAPMSDAMGAEGSEAAGAAASGANVSGAEASGVETSDAETPDAEASGMEASGVEPMRAEASSSDSVPRDCRAPFGAETGLDAAKDDVRPLPGDFRLEPAAGDAKSSEPEHTEDTAGISSPDGLIAAAGRGTGKPRSASAGGRGFVESSGSSGEARPADGRGPAEVSAAAEDGDPQSARETEPETER